MGLWSMNHLANYQNTALKKETIVLKYELNQYGLFRCSGRILMMSDITSFCVYHDTDSGKLHLRRRIEGVALPKII